MIHRTITFRREGLDDPAEDASEAVNEMQGRACALWLRGSLNNFPNDRVIGPGAEDWGWYLGVKRGRDTYVLGCTSLDESQWVVHVSDFYNRGVFPWMRRRKFVVLETLAGAVENWIRADPAVRAVEIS